MHSARSFLSVLFALCLRAQPEGGEIKGAITDALGRPVAAANVAVISVSGGARRLLSTSGQGEYIVTRLTPGSYTVEVSAPAFLTVSRNVRLQSGSRAVENFVLSSPAAAPTLTLGQKELNILPDLSRDPYHIVRLAGNLSDAGMGTRGAGVAINGLRESSTSVLLDGSNNRDEYAAAIGQPIPLEAVRQLSVITSGFPSGYARGPGVVASIVTKSGTNEIRGSAYGYLRSSALTANSFEANAEGRHRAGFTRGDFGYSIGGPVLRNKVFAFSSAELRDVRSDGTAFAWIPAPELLSQTAANTQNFFKELGQLRPDASVLGAVNLASLAASRGANPCTGLTCAALSTSAPLLLRVSYPAPGYSPAGQPQWAIVSFHRVDYTVSASTFVHARYAFSHESDSRGVLSNSPYRDYDLGRRLTDNTVAVSVFHSWGPQWSSETTVGYSRFNLAQQGLTTRGLIPTMYANPFAPVAIGTDYLALPGYNPLTPGGGGAFGGPENVSQFTHETGFSRARHHLRMGGWFESIRDNRTYAAYQTSAGSLSGGGGLGPALNGLITGVFAHMQIAVDPHGKFPCRSEEPDPDCLLNLPASPPDFSRSNITRGGSLYVEDSLRLHRRLTASVGLRWDHFGVQHSRRPGLDSNWYAPGISAESDLAHYLRNGGLELAAQSPVAGLWRPDWKNFAPTGGIALDLFGNGTTVVRAGYTAGYERNIGAVTFNVFQNAPNYAVVDVPSPITVNNLGALASPGSLAIPPLGARIVNPDLKTARARLWNASLERQLGRGVRERFEYSGSRGKDLYSISYPNQAGFGNLVLGDSCLGIGDCDSQPNSRYSEEVGYRGNQGFSSYRALANTLTVDNLLRTGISFRATYTWSHAVDNLSSTFFEAGGQGVASQFGDRNITINNGDFVAGLLDPYDPNLDRGDAEFDVRHRVVVMGVWTLPSRRGAGWPGRLAGGWSMVPVFLARSGQPFSVFDTSQQVLSMNAPRAVFAGDHPIKRNTFVADATPDLFHLITFYPAQILRQQQRLTPGSGWPAGMSARDSFRAPGFWNLDLALHKVTRIGDRYTLQIRADVINILNHANLYLAGRSADVGRANTIDGCFGCTGSSFDQRQIQLAVRFTF